MTQLYNFIFKVFLVFLFLNANFAWGMEEGDRNCTTSHGISYHPTYQDQALSEEELKAYESLPQKARKTLTLDNDGEFAAHERWLLLRLPNEPSHAANSYPI